MAWHVGTTGSLQLLLMFLSLTLINRITVWERYNKVLASISCFLSTMLPNEWYKLNIIVNGSNSMEAIMLLIFVPTILTGMHTLLHCIV
jgi:hypothetical protein